MSTYLLINILIILFPLLLSFDKKVAFYKKIPSVIISISIIGLIYIVWDVIAVNRGDWNFNRDFINGFILFNLPIEEILFFITVPYSCIFLYEVINSYFHESQLNLDNKIVTILILLLTTLAVIFNKQYYTFTVLLFSAAFLFISVLSSSLILKSKVFWLTIAVSYLPFFVVNYFLTSLPVVEYSKKAIWGLRIITIPLEDLLYSYSLISFWLFTYLIFKNYLNKKRYRNLN